MRETEKEGKKRNNESSNRKILNKIHSIFYFLLVIHSLPTHPPKFPFPSILVYRTRDFGFLRRFYERREINFPLSCTPQPRKPRLSFPFGRNLSTLHPLARFFLTSLPSLDPPDLSAIPSNPLDARSFATALFAFNVIFTTLVYIPPAAWRSQRTINYRTRTRHYRYTYSSRERVPPFLSLSRFVHPQRVSISIPESVRAEINYPRIHEDSSLRPMKYSRHDDTARLVSPGQGYKSRGPWVEKKSGLETGKLGRLPILFECTPRL